MKRALMIAYHFPPLAGSSGIQRTLRFAQHLPRSGWQPLVLTANPRAYERTAPDLDAEVPKDCVVRRAFALDTARHLSLGSRYIGALARPDRWMSWKFDAVRQGLRMIAEYRPQVIWSTYPIATAHLIGAELQRRSGLPWVADFRDPMAQDGYPTDPKTWAVYREIEARAAQQACRCVFTTPGAARMYRERYPHAAQRMLVLENGYDEESFVAAEAGAAAGPLTPGALTLLHSGIVYPSERDPTQLIVALARLRQSGDLVPGRFRLRFRAPVHETLLADMARANGVESFVEILPPLPYGEALTEMLRADALLVMQAANCNEQIPAKLYEYLRAGRPIVCLTDPQGDTAGALRAAGVRTTARLDSAEETAALLRQLLTGDPEPLLPERAVVQAASRAARAAELAQCFERCIGSSAEKAQVNSNE